MASNNTTRLAVAAIVALMIVGPWTRPTVAAPSTALPAMIKKDTARRIERGLRYLARTQRSDGSWLNSGGYGTYPVVMTSLASLALMAGGSTPESGPYSRNVLRGLNYVLNVAESYNKRPDGAILIAGGGSEGRSMYGHGFGMLFLAQCYGVEGDKTSQRARRIKKVLDGAVKLTVGAQSDLGAKVKHAGGWIYTPTGRGDEGSVTVTQLQALRACRNVGIDVPKQTIDRAVHYLKICQNKDGGICYSYRSRGSSRPAISAAAIACFYSAGIYDRQTGGKGSEAAMVEKLVAYCRKKVTAKYNYGHYFYTHLYMSQSMYQRGGEDWKKYFPAIRDRLAEMQMPDGNWNGDSVGEIYGTAIATMILQLPYGYLPIMQR